MLRVLAPLGLTAVVLAGCGSADRAAPAAGRLPADLVAEARPIGSGANFHPPVSGPVFVGCRRRLGARVGVHVELFAANRVVIVAAGIGTRGPYTFSAGRISAARCYGDLVTLEDEAGFWEAAGYHNYGDPWRESYWSD